MDKERSFDLNIGIPNGIILTVIGILVLLTPVFHHLEPSHVLIDIAAGILLVAGGGTSLYFGIRKMKK